MQDALLADFSTKTSMNLQSKDKPPKTTTSHHNCLHHQSIVNRTLDLE